MKHFILTRWNIDIYDEMEDPEAWMTHRLQLFEVFTLPSMQRQTCMDFEWLIWFDPLTPQETIDRVAGMMPQITPVVYPPGAEFTKVLPLAGKYTAVKGYVKKHRGEVTITTRLDNDDYVERGFIEGIQRAAAGCEVDTVIDYHGRVLDLAAGRFYDPARPYPTSMFISLVEHGDPETVWVQYHYKMNEHYPTIHLPEMGWVMVIHGGNASNKIEKQMHTNVPQDYYL